MPSAYIRISADNFRYVERITTAVNAETGADLSKSQVIDLILTEARLRNWAVAVDTVRIAESAMEQ